MNEYNELEKEEKRDMIDLYSRIWNYSIVFSSQQYINNFFNIAIELVEDFGCENSVEYHSYNFGYKTNNERDLLEFLRGSHYNFCWYLGFRSIFRLLIDNIDKVTTERLLGYHNRLCPDLFCYK